MEDENEYLKLPVEERCVHKLWKARVSGYEEALKLFNQFDGDDSNWKKVMFRVFWKMYFYVFIIRPKYGIVIWQKWILSCLILSVLGAASSRWVGECFDFLHFFVHLLEDAAQ